MFDRKKVRSDKIELILLLVFFFCRFSGADVQR